MRRRADTLRQVAAEAGIDHSTIHRYFPTKQTTAVVDYATRQFWIVGQPEGGPADLLRYQLDRLARMIVERTELFRRCVHDGAVVPGVEAASAAELVIAAVKGASLAPGRAVEVLGQLHRLLIPPGHDKERP